MNLTKAPNSTHKTKRIGRGQGSGMGKTATKGGKGQTARKGYNKKRGFEGGQQPLQRRLPKVGFTSKFTKPYTINIEKVKAVKDLAEISFESLKSVHKFPKSVEKIKLIGIGARDLASKIKDKNITTSGGEKSAVSKGAKSTAKNSAAAKNSAENSAAAKSKTAAADENSQKSVNSSENSAPKPENSSKAQKNSQKSVNSKAENSKPKAEKAPAEKKAENSAKAKTEKAAKKPAAKKESEAK